MSSGLLELPEEIQLNILLSLPSHLDILHCSQTCKPFRALVIASRAVQYRIQLGRCGMIEGNSVSTLQKSSEERSKLLHETIGRRRTFEPVFIHDLGMTEANHDRAFDLLDGIYVRLTHEPVETSAPDGEAVARLIIKDLSGDCRRPAQVTQLDVFPTDISIAPSLDLIVLLVVEHEALQEPFLRLHMRTLSSGGLQDHSDAQKPVLRFPHKFLMPALLEPEFHISIDKDVLALYVAESAVEVFRWTTGRHILSWDYVIKPSVTLVGFSLISPTCFAIGHCAEPSVGYIGVYRLPSSNEPDDRQMQTDDIHIELSLPRFYQQQRDLVTGIFTSPPRSLIDAFEEASRITVVQMTVEEVAPAGVPEGECENLTFVFRQRFFAEAWDHYIDEPGKLATVKFPWDEWGPLNSRLLDLALDDFPDNSVCSGSRFIYRRLFDDWVSTISDSDESMAHPFYYIDFGDIQDMDFLEAVRKEVAPAGPQVNRMVASNDEDLLHNVRTSLPYYAVETRRETFNWSTVLIDGNRIICSRPVEGEGWEAEYGGRSIEHVYEL